jgi:tripartite-type tricarboxylate transporter receptor subunit TctC
MTGVQMVHIPYKGSAPAVAALISGEVSLSFTTTPAVLPQAKAGRLKIIAVTTAQRVAELPGIPTVAESGLPSYEAVSWFGLVGPAALPADLVRKIHADAVKILNTQEMRERIASHGATPLANTPEQFRAQIRQDLDKWARVVKISGAKAD